ncbi:hypothetical protein LCGC14_3138250, partial [marine sediment metagenome]
MIPSSRIIDDAREKMAELEHEQWIAWSKNIAETDNISIERAERWAKLWIPYSELTEEQKDQDRVWAGKPLALSGTKDIECPKCEGKGFFRCINLNKIVTSRKSVNKMLDQVKCLKCNGTGSILQKWKVSVVLENG